MKFFDSVGKYFDAIDNKPFWLFWVLICTFILVILLFLYFSPSPTVNKELNIQQKAKHINIKVGADVVVFANDNVEINDSILEMHYNKYFLQEIIINDDEKDGQYILIFTPAGNGSLENSFE